MKACTQTVITLRLSLDEARHFVTRATDAQLTIQAELYKNHPTITQMIEQTMPKLLAAPKNGKKPKRQSERNLVECPRCHDKFKRLGNHMRFCPEPEPAAIAVET